MKSATTTEITRHMITAMTIPTYRATSSVLGATGGGRGGWGGWGEIKDREKNCVLISYNFTPVVFNFLCGL